MKEHEGRILRLLKDDTIGARHQRFIIQKESGQTLLISHNIDIAPRIRGLHLGAKISLRGKYVRNDLGGLVHWTHKDPHGSDQNGWIDFEGMRYE